MEVMIANMLEEKMRGIQREGLLEKTRAEIEGNVRRQFAILIGRLAKEQEVAKKERENFRREKELLEGEMRALREKVNSFLITPPKEGGSEEGVLRRAKNLPRPIDGEGEEWFIEGVEESFSPTGIFENGK